MERGIQGDVVKEETEVWEVNVSLITKTNKERAEVMKLYKTLISIGELVNCSMETERI